jgi:hypothetical protein
VTFGFRKVDKASRTRHYMDKTNLDNTTGHHDAMSLQVGEMPDSNPGLQVLQSGALPIVSK